MTTKRAPAIGFGEIVSSEPPVWEIQTAGPGPQGSLPLTAEMLLERPSGDIFGMTQNAGMGWDPRELGATITIEDSARRMANPASCGRRSARSPSTPR